MSVAVRSSIVASMLVYGVGWHWMIQWPSVVRRAKIQRTEFNSNERIPVGRTYI